MRTATHFFKGNGYKEFAKIFSGFYPGGKLAVICDGKEDGLALARALGDSYNISVYGINDNPKLSDGARFVIGVGKRTVIPAVKRAVKNAKFVFVPAEFDYRYLHDFDGNPILPEFVYLDEEIFRREKAYADAYVSVFELYTEFVFRMVYGSIFPYRDSALIGIKDSLEKFLLGTTDYGDFFSEAMRIVSVAVNELVSRKTKSLITAKICSLTGMSVSDRFAVSYLLQLIVMNFTKRYFRDILLPSEKRTTGRNIPAYAFDSKVINGDNLRVFACKMRAMADIVPPDFTLIVKTLSAVADESNPLFSIINDKGITDALNYEKLKRH